MATLTKQWPTGTGNLSVTYEGSGEGSAVFTSDTNEGIDRVMDVAFKAGDIVEQRIVTQEGLRQPFGLSGGGVFRIKGGGRFGVLKNAIDNSINIEDYLTIEALADGLTVTLANYPVDYCIDGSGQWKTLDAGVASEAINTGQTISFKAEYTSSDNSRRFSISKSCNLIGDPMSLYYGDNAKDYNTVPYTYSFSYLFYNCTTIVDATRLVLDRKLKSYAYSYMFYGCSNLLYPPELPATTLSTGCYRYMFRNCSNLLKAPVLPALTLTSYCYEYMFTACSDLAEITMLATNKSASNCMLGWVSKVKSKGTFYKNKDATWTTTGVSGVPSGWTVILI